MTDRITTARATAMTTEGDDDRHEGEPPDLLADGELRDLTELARRLVARLGRPLTLAVRCRPAGRVCPVRLSWRAPGDARGERTCVEFVHGEEPAAEAVDATAKGGRGAA